MDEYCAASYGMNTVSPLVTVYVPCRNYGRFLTQCVESVLTQLYTNWELILVDEASEDDTASIVENLHQRCPDRITVIRNPEPLGLQKLANRVLGMAKGKYTMRVDADDWLDEGALLLMVSKLEASPDAGLVYGNYFYTNAEGDVLGVERRHHLGVEDRVGHLPPHGACTLFRTRALKAVGGYSEDIDAQDGWELWYKLVTRVGAVSLDVPVFYYRQHDTSLSRDYQRLLTARSRIFARIGNGLEGGYKPICAAVIPVRESYPGFEGVPYREYDGSSVLERAILSAAEASVVTQVIVSSQSQRVLDFAADLEAQGKVPKHARVLRDDIGINTSKLPILDIMLHAGEFHKELNGTTPDIITFLSIHAVHRRAEHVEKAINVLRIIQGDSVVSVQEEREPIFQHGSNGLKLLNPGRFQDLIYDRERLYSYNGAVIAAWWEVLQTGELLGQKISYIEMSYRDSLQIKTS
jgi:glycosyltransferase involved in cell wall biosynthesis